METRELLRDIIREDNAKQIAEDMGISPSLLYKWFESGEQARTNPLEHLIALYRATGDRRLVGLLCAKAGGFFVENPPAKPSPAGETLMQALGHVHREAAELDRVLADIEAAGIITPAEARRLRKQWERVKSKQEGLVRDAERGRFAKKLSA